MKYSQLYPSKHLRGADIEQPIQVKVKQVVVEEVGHDREQKPVAYFVGDTKPMVLNKTNGAKLVTITGSDESSDWAGARLEIYTEQILMRGERVPSLHIRAIRAEGDDIPSTWGDEPVTGGKKKKVA